MKRDIQGKFALKNNDYRFVRSLRLTDETWTALGVAAECLGMTRADYLEEMVKGNARPRITREEKSQFPCNTWQQKNTDIRHSELMVLPQITDLLALRDRILFELKLGRQAPGYKAAHKVLTRFIAELTNPV